MRGRLLGHLRRRAEWYWAPALYTVFVAVLYGPILGGDQGLGWDTIESYWPDLVFFSDQLGQGEWPLWNPHDRGGYPFYADPQASLWYPIQWFFAGLGALFKDASWPLIQIKMLGHHVLAAVLMHAFLRTRGLERAAAVVGALAWIAGTPWLIHKASNVLLPLAWTPLVWIAIDRFAANPSARTAMLLAGAVYLPGSAGSPPGFFYTLLLIGSYGIYRLTETAMARGRTGEMGSYLRRAALFGAIGAAVSVITLLIVVLPALELAEASPRAERGLAYALSSPLSPGPTLIGLLVPAGGSFDAYLGIFPLFLGIAALALRPTRQRGTPIFLVVSAGFFLLLAFGGSTPLLGWLVEHVPGFGLFRVASRYKLLFGVQMAALAGYGASTVIRSRSRLSNDNLRLAGAILFVYAIVAVLALRTAAVEPRGEPPADSAIIGALAVLLILVIGWLGGRRAALVAAVAGTVMAFDADHFWHWQGKILEARVDHREDLDKLSSLPEAGRDLRIYDEFQLEQRAGSRLGLRDFRGYPSGDPLDLQRYRDVLSRIDETPELLAAYNVGYVLIGPHHRNQTQRNYLQRRPSAIRPELFARAGTVDIARAPAPRVAWYNTVLAVDADSALGALAVQARREPDARLAIVESSEMTALGELRSALESDKTLLSGAGTVEEFSADGVRATVKVASPALVVLNEVDYPGWRVMVNGEPATPVTANHLLRGVAVGPGTHVIEWEFAPGEVPWLLACWLLAMAAIAVAAFGAQGRRAWQARRR